MVAADRSSARYSQRSASPRSCQLLSGSQGSSDANTIKATICKSNEEQITAWHNLDTEILKWRTEIIAADPLCKSQVADQKCESFEVACKAERTITPADQAKGISARVVAAMTWSGFDPKFQHAQSGSRTAEFSKTGSGWTRAEHAPVNMTSCADL